jgi:hypothetical protein
VLSGGGPASSIPDTASFTIKPKALIGGGPASAMPAAVLLIPRPKAMIGGGPAPSIFKFVSRFLLMDGNSIKEDTPSMESEEYDTLKKDMIDPSLIYHNMHLSNPSHARLQT